MKSLSKYLFILPVIILIAEIYWLTHTDLSPKKDPLSDKNSTPSRIVALLDTAGNRPLDLYLNDADSEIEFYLKGTTPKSFFKVILSTKKPPLAQVNALQKVIKIANIKGKAIRLIDLSSSRPYATL